MPAALITLVEGWLGPKFARFARPLIYLVAALLLALAAFVAVKIHDHRVVAVANDRQGAANANADKHADDHAADQRRTDDGRLVNETDELNRSSANAQTNLARQLAFQHCLRAQQSARAAKRQPPACS
jgi:hypothetical protein